jgi:hypothetical protein
MQDMNLKSPGKEQYIECRTFTMKLADFGDVSKINPPSPRC